MMKLLLGALAGASFSLAFGIPKYGFLFALVAALFVLAFHSR